MNAVHDSRLSDEGPARFTLGAYLRDHTWVVLIIAVIVLVLYGLLRILDLGLDASLVVCAFVFLTLSALPVAGYLRRRAFYQELEQTIRDLEHSYYLPSLLGRPDFLDGRILYDACESICRADAVDISRAREECATQREFAELWAHELKTPLAAADLTLSRMSGPDAVALRQNMERMHLACERVLFSAKSSDLSDDYRIVATPLLPVCRECVKSVANLLIESGVAPHFDIPEDLTVLTDASWLAFVVRQVVTNSAKYGARSITFSATSEGGETPGGRTVLCISDDGIGIPAADLPRVFRKGFSGSNGRAEGTSTGFGLYLSLKVCEAMGLGLDIASEEGAGTQVLVTFPHDRSRLLLEGRE